MSELFEKINNAVKDAMRSREQRRLVVLRLITSSIKQQEIANRTESSREALNDSQILTVLERMVKQRVDAKEQFEKANRIDLAEQEGYEIDVLREFMPTQLSEDELLVLVNLAVDIVQPKGPADMGKMVAHLKPQVQGRADMKLLSEIVKARLANLV